MDEAGTILNEEYETQFYEFVPSDLMEGIKSLINDHFDDVITKLHVQMAKFPKSALPESELNEGISQLRKASTDHNAKTLKKLESYLLKCMNIPPHVLLPEDEDQAVSHTKSEVEELEEKIRQLKVQIKNEKYVESVLKDELKEIEVVLRAQERLLKTSLSPAAINSLEETKEKLNFLSEQIKKTLNATAGLQDTVQTENFQRTLQNLVECDIFQ